MTKSITGWQFTLFVFGQTERNWSIVHSLNNLFVRLLSSGFDLQVIDLHKQPELGSKYGVIATPMLLRKYPTPEKRIIGDISGCFDRVARLLELPRPNL